MARTVEIKYDFEPFDCIPSDKAKRFRRNLLQHGSKADKYGYTFADTSGALAQRERRAQARARPATASGAGRGSH